jgi:hypothetical protein
MPRLFRTVNETGLTEDSKLNDVVATPCCDIPKQELKEARRIVAQVRHKVRRGRWPISASPIYDELRARWITPKKSRLAAVICR